MLSPATLFIEFLVVFYLGLDFRVNGIKLRAMAVYVPHCGYDIEHFNETFDQLRCFASAGRRKGRRLVIGGDFNTQIDIGERGECLNEFVRTFCLTIANKSTTPWDDQWTFRSCLGDTRKIAFITVSSAFQCIDGKAVSEIDLGSDHRAVRGHLQVHAFKPYIRDKKKKIKKSRLVLELALPVALMCRNILRDGVWPARWKVHWVMPLHKKNPRALPASTLPWYPFNKSIG